MGLFSTKGSAEALRTAGSLSTVGLAFVLALVIGFWFGSSLDRWLSTTPILTIVFFFAGLAAGILNVYRIVSQAYPARGPSEAQAAPPEDRGPTDRELDRGDD